MQELYGAIRQVLFQHLFPPLSMCCPYMAYYAYRRCDRQHLLSSKVEKVRNSIRGAREKQMKRFLLPVFCFFLFSLTGCGVIDHVVGSIIVPTSVTIEGVTYRSGFYGELYPLFGQVGDIGSDTLQKETVFDVGSHQFCRVGFEGHDWIHSFIGSYSGGTVYCAENEWEQMRDYYADPSNFEYYLGVGHYMIENSVSIPEIDTQRFDELLAFGNENQYKPFDRQSNEAAMKKVRRIPEAEYLGGICFYKVSNDGYFTTIKNPMYFVHGGKLLLVFYHDGGRDNGGIREVVAIDVPDELGQYFIELSERYQQ